jgi:hypothetical protein
MKLRNRLIDYAAMDGPDADLDAMVQRAIVAQRAIKGWPEERVDVVPLALATARRLEIERSYPIKVIVILITGEQVTGNSLLVRDLMRVS